MCCAESGSVVFSSSCRRSAKPLLHSFHGSNPKLIKRENAKIKVSNSPLTDLGIDSREALRANQLRFGTKPVSHGSGSQTQKAIVDDLVCVCCPWDVEE